MASSRLVTGPRAVEEALRSRPDAIDVLYVARDGARALDAIVAQARDRRVRVEERERADLDALAAQVRHQGVIAVVGPYPYVTLDALLDAMPARPLLVALDQITDPHNLGAIVRSAVAFGAHGVITLKDRAAPVTPVVVRAAAGATEHARIARVTNLARTLERLAEAELSIVGLAAEGTVDVDALPEAPAGRVLVIGSEGRGLRRLVRERCTVLASITMSGPIASLNASVAAGIALCAAARQR